MDEQTKKEINTLGRGRNSDSQIFRLIQIIPAEQHKFRNVYPNEVLKDVNDYQENLWEKEVS